MAIRTHRLEPCDDDCGSVQRPESGSARIRCIELFESLPRLIPVIGIARLRKIREHQLEHFPRGRLTALFLGNLSGPEGTGRRHRGGVRREADGRSDARIGSGVQHIHGAAELLRIVQHDIQIVAFRTMRIEIPHVHKAHVVRGQWQRRGPVISGAPVARHRKEHTNNQP